MEFGSLLGALSSGRVDFVMAGMTPTEERKKNADFTDIYFESKNLVMTKDKAISSEDELKGKKSVSSLVRFKRDSRKTALKTAKRFH